MIDVHSHIVPSSLPRPRFADERWPSIEIRGDTGLVTVNGRPFRTVESTCWDIGRRSDDLDRRAVTRQLVSPMPELFAYWAAPADAERYCREINLWIADWLGTGDGRFDGLGIIPLQDPERAAAMLAEVKQAGLVGVEVGSNVGGVTIAAPQFDVVFREAEEHDLAVFVHAFHPAGFDQIDPPLVANAVTFPLEAGFAAAALIARRIPADGSRLRLLISHGGGCIPFTVPRLTAFRHAFPGVADALGGPPTDTMRRTYYDSAVYGADSLRFLVESVGSDRVVLGSDYPFFPEEIGALVSETFASEPTVRDRILHDNPLAFIHGAGIHGPGIHGADIHGAG